MPDEFGFEEEAEDVGFLPDEDVIKAAVDIPRAATASIQRVLPVIQPSIESTRKYLAPQRGALEAMRIAALPPGASEAEIASEAGVPFTQPFTEGPETLAQTAAIPLREAIKTGTQTYERAHNIPPPFVIDTRNEQLDQMTREQERERIAPPNQPLVQFQRTALHPEGEGGLRLLEGLSTPENITLLAAGQGGPMAALGILATMVPGVVGDIKSVIAGNETQEQKEDRIRSLLFLGVLAAKGSVRAPGELPERIRSITPPGKGGTPLETMETEEQLKPLPLTGAEIPGLPKRVLPRVPVTSSPEVLGPPPVLPPQVPETAPEPQKGMSVIEEIRTRNLRTNKQIRQAFPEYAGEVADLRRMAWGGAPDTGVEVSPTIPRPSPMPPLTPRAPEETAAMEQAQRIDRAAEEQARKAPILQQIITWERELEFAQKRGDQRAVDEASNKLLDLRKQFEGIPPVKTISPKPPIARAPGTAFRPEVPGTPAEERETVLETIRKANARTRGEIQRLFPQRGLSRQEAAELRDAAWGKRPPEEPPTAGPAGTPVEPPPPTPPAAPNQMEMAAPRKPPLNPKERRALEARAEEAAGDDAKAKARLEAIRRDHAQIRRELEGAAGAQKIMLEDELRELEDDLRKMVGEQPIHERPAPTKADQEKNRVWLERRLNEIKQKLERGEALDARDRQYWRIAGGKDEDLPPPSAAATGEQPPGPPAQPTPTSTPSAPPEGGAPVSPLDKVRQEGIDQGIALLKEQVGLREEEARRLVTAKNLREEMENVAIELGLEFTEDEKKAIAAAHMPDLEGAAGAIIESTKPSALTQEPTLTPEQKARLQGKVKRAKEEGVLSPKLTPDDLEPALLVNGKPVTGGDNHDAIFNAALDKPGITEEETAAIFKAFGDDSKHVFVDKTGKTYTRAEAATALGETDPLHSQRLSELKKGGAGAETTPPISATPAPEEEGTKPVTLPEEKPTTLEGTVIAGKTLAEWEAVKDASQLPKGDARAELARWLAVPNQPSRILQALANKKRTREIHAPPAAEVSPVTPPTPDVMPAAEGPPTEPTHPIIEAVTDELARRQGQREQELEGIIKTLPADMQRQARRELQEALAKSQPQEFGAKGPAEFATDVINRWKKRAEEVSQMPEVAPEPKPAPPETKPAETAPKTPEGATVAPAEKKKRAEVPAITQKQLDEQFAKYFGEGAAPRGPEGTVKITSKTLKAQRENLLGQVEQAIKDAPDTGTEKITISVPGDGDFTIFNTKEALKTFRDIAAKQFPTSVEQSKAKIGGTKVSTTKSGKASTLPRVSEPTPEELPKLAGNFVSTDQSRGAIQTVYSDGTQIVATDGRQLIRIVTPNAPGTPAKPVRLDPDGIIDEEATSSGTFPNYNQVRPTDLTLLKGAAKTDELWKIGKQAQGFKSSYGDKAQEGLELFLNPDGTFGGRNVQAGGDQFEHNVQPNSISLGTLNADYLTDAMDVARKLGNEQIDVYASGTTGPFSFIGKNHEHLVMPMRSGDGIYVRPDPTKISASLSGKAINVRPAEGLGPLTPPESFNSRVVEPQGGKYNVTYEDGVFKVAKHFPKTGAYSTERWDEIASLARTEEKSPNNAAIREALTKGLKREPTKEEVSKIKGAMDEIMSDRRARIREGEERLKAAQPSKGPGAAAQAEFADRPPDPEVLGVSAGNPVYNRIDRAFRNLFSGVAQWTKRRATKQEFAQAVNAADNIPRQAGLEAGNSLRERATTQQQQAITALMQSLKMSSRGGRQAIDWLRGWVTDMETKAQEFINNGEKLEGQAAIDWRNASRYAADHFNELVPLAQLAKRKFDMQHRRLGAAGVDVNYENWYVPQRHELDLMTGQDRPVVLGHSRGSGAATGFKKAKVYDTYADAIEAGFIPRSLAIGDLLEHYVSTTEKLLTYKALFNSLGEVRDTVDNNPLAMKIPRRVIERADGTTDVQESVPLGYVPMEVAPGVRMAIHRGYERLVRALTASSQLSESALVGALQDVAAVEKHFMLALDTFHASRTLQAELALTGKASLPYSERLARGRALAELSPQDLDQAVRNGRITQEIADWIRTPTPIEIGGRTVNLSPRNIFRIGLQSGLNVTRFADVMYRDWLRQVPILGEVNRWVFDKMTRSAMSQAYISEFTRNAKNNPQMTAKQVGLKTASDLNVMFGNLQKESIFRNPSLRAINQIVFLAPQWVESLARREGRFVKQLGETAIRAARGEGVTFGTVGRGIGTGLAAYFAATQIANLISRGHLTFQNPEEGHKLDAWIPIGPRGMFISPLSVFGEVAHDIYRFAQTKPDYFQVGTQIASNKLGNLGRFLEVVATGRDPLSGEKVVGTAKRALKAGAQLLPVPITVSGVGRKLASETGLVQPPAPGAVPRQVASSFGFKMEPAPSAQQQMWQKAQRWSLGAGGKIQAQAERRLKEDFGPSDYSNLRAALTSNDLAGARRAYQQLRESGKTPVTIRQTMEHPHPFTGSAANEAKFQRSLTPEEKELYRAAVAERRELARRYHQMLQQPK